MTQSQAPIALFVYNRPDHAGRVLDDLSHCRRIEECRLHVFCDGPRDAEDRARVQTCVDSSGRQRTPGGYLRHRRKGPDKGRIFCPT